MAMIGTAPIYALTEDATQGESVVWARFASAKGTTEFWGVWLSILCLQIGRVGGGLLLLGPDADGSYTPAAVWPRPTIDMQYLSPAAERTLNERRGIVVTPEGASAKPHEQRAYVGYPIEVSGELRGAVVLDVAAASELGLQHTLRLLHWSSAWLVDEFRKRALEDREARLSRMGLVMGIVATAVQERRHAAAALAVANELAAQLGCDRVSIGFAVSGNVEVKAISHTATFDPKLKLARLIGEAMDEVLDLDVVITYPSRENEEVGTIAHGELAREFRDVAVCSVPLQDDQHTIGVLTLERSGGAAFDPETVEMLKTVGGVLGPLFGLQQDIERGVLRRAWGATREGVQALVGRSHPGVKLLALAAAAVLLFLSLASGAYRISAKTVVEGAVQRVAAVPFDGYILQSMVRAGDTVQNGDTLARLDDRELKLEQTRLLSEREQLLRRQREALATKDRAQVAELAAQIEQVAAASSLADDKLSRATLTAPFDGVVVSGDLSQLLGTPVEQGKALFEIAPLDSYRVILEIDERDISNVVVGQRGELTLSGIPNQHTPFTVQRITPVSTTQEGRNFFRVEAHLENGSEGVRPGMEGVGKIVVDRRKLIWIWTHSLVDWMSLSWWKWAP
jgi:RND family efflux transporter MFP subunit